MKVVLDTNIIFSVLSNTNGTLSRYFFQFPPAISYYAPDFLVSELQLHSSRLIKISGISKTDYEIAKTSIFTLINFVDTEHIPEEFMREAVVLTKEIDFKDFKFVALTMFLNGILWTGDRKLLNGLRRKGFMNAVNTKELSIISGGLYNE
jgi:predicted nucleic acid-binding protein